MTNRLYSSLDEKKGSGQLSSYRVLFCDWHPSHSKKTSLHDTTDGKALVAPVNNVADSRQTP